MNSEQLIRLECLKLALAVPHSERGGAAATMIAGQYETFVRGAESPPGSASAQKEKPQDKGRSPR